MTTSKFIKIFFLIILGITLESCGIAPRTLGTYIEDHAIVSHANKITNNGDANEQKYSVQAHAYNEILLLTGEVAREKTRLDILENMTNHVELVSVQIIVLTNKKNKFKKISVGILR